MRVVLALSVLCLAATPVLAYDGFSPLSGPNTAIPSPVCDLINFGFCPQPAPPPPPFPDPNAAAADETAAPAALAPPRHRRGHRARLRPS